MRVRSGLGWYLKRYQSPLKSQIDGCRNVRGHFTDPPTLGFNRRSEIAQLPWPRNVSLSTSTCQAHTPSRSISTSQPSKVSGSCNYPSKTSLLGATQSQSEGCRSPPPTSKFPQGTAGHHFLQDQHAQEFHALHRVIEASQWVPLPHCFASPGLGRLRQPRLHKACLHAFPNEEVVVRQVQDAATVP